MKLYSVTLEGYYTIQDAIEFMNSMVWSEVETTEQIKPFHSKKVCLSDDKTVALYFDFGADYFYFEDVTE